MTEPVTSPSGTLDLSVDSTQLTARKGEGIIWVQEFRDASNMPVDISGWTIDARVRNGTNPATQQPININIDTVQLALAGQTGMERGSIQFFLDTALLTALTPSTGRSSMTVYEVEATFDSGRVDSNGDPLMRKQVIQVGQIVLFADIYDSTVSP